MTKLEIIRQELVSRQLPTDETEYWNEVEISGDNATDYVCDMDNFIKQLIQIIDE
jgi:hypothetical protein